MLELPLELRRQIYKELFISAAKHDPCHWESYLPLLRGKDPWDCLIDELRNYPPKCYDYSILRVSRQVYQEAIPILYEETRFYARNLWPRIKGNFGWKVLPDQLSKLRHLRLEFSLVYEREGAIPKAIELSLKHCPLLDDLDLQLSFWSKSSRYSNTYIEPSEALATTLSGLNLRKGLKLTLKDLGYISGDVLRDFRMKIAPEEKWHCCGWDYAFDFGASVCQVKWVRAWSLGSTNAKLRFLEEPSEEAVRQIIQ